MKAQMKASSDPSTEPVTIDLTSSDSPKGVPNPCDVAGCKNPAVRVRWCDGEQYDYCEEHA